MSIPHFATGLYGLGQVNQTMTCQKEDYMSNECTALKMHQSSQLSNYFYVFIIGQLLHGIGGTGLLGVGTVLIDESVKPSKTPFYLSLVYGSIIFGAGVGYMVGGNFLNIYVDFDSLDEPTNLQPTDPQWIGAWWLGPLLACLGQLLVAIPISLYGDELPTAKTVRQCRVNQAHQVQGSKADLMAVGDKTLLYYIKIVFILLQNPCFIFVTLTMTSEAIFLAGCSAFLPKFIENEFRIQASRAAIYAGKLI